MEYRFATESDLDLLAEYNHQLIRDEGHRSPMTVPELRARLSAWLRGEYQAVICASEGEPLAYALYRESATEVCLRQLFVRRDLRRQGIGRQVVGILRSQVWPPHKRLTVEVLTVNAAALAFWRAVGFRDYSLTLEVLPEEVGAP
ncbi:MAG: GNAT family N-acetyltransferase [Candidatus Latescibacterota bacterium]